MRETSVDVAVVGNGVLGPAVAVETAGRAPGLRIAVFGPPGRDGAATTAAGAMLSCFGEVTRYTGWHPAAQAKFALARQALDRWPAWLEQLAEDAGPPTGETALRSHVPGTFVVLGAGAGAIASDNFTALCRAVEEHGEPHDVIDPADVPGLDPAPQARPQRAVHLHREGCVDARAVGRLGGGRPPAPGTDGAGHRVRGAGQRGHGTRGPAGRRQHARRRRGRPGRRQPQRRADHRCAAARGGAPAAARRRIRPADPAHPARRRPPGDPHPNRAAGCGLHLLPLPGTERQYLGATNFVTCHRPDGPVVGATEILIRSARQEIDQALADSRLTAWMWGARPITLDGFPLIGSCPVAGLHFATGTYRDGFHCAPVIARHLAVRLLGPGPADADLAWFTPHPAPIETMTVEQSLTETATHAAETAREHGLRLPFFLDDEPVATYVRDRAHRLFDRLGHPVALPPEILLLAFILAARGNDHPARWLAGHLHAARTHHAPAPGV
ncbi:FAD-binding oxidoreductase/lyase [Streptomyces rimosus]|uniref:FAD-dependent oxidoreductase n=1 Tax=Streptomyces rimosus TaxID=1927 RepID=UPI00131E0151|nr:FAD-dependent oxidoreductase [Streptomyces rimosus]